MKAMNSQPPSAHTGHTSRTMGYMLVTGKRARLGICVLACSHGSQHGYEMSPEKRF